MKACVITKHGGPDVVSVIDMPMPEVSRGEVLIRLQAAALNHLDLNVRNGGGRFSLPMPHILGSDGAGIVERTGDGVDGFEPGDEVIINPGLACGVCEFCIRGQDSECASFGIIGAGRHGTFAEYASIPATNLAPKPIHLTFEEAAALPLAHLTAWRMLMTRAKMRAGETVLIHGIGGGVALAALQFACMGGAETIVTSSSSEKLERAQRLGAHHVINYKSQDVVAEVKRFTCGRGVDIVFDSVGAATWGLDFATVRKAGRIVICGVNKGAIAETNLQALYWNQLTIYGSTLGSREDFRQMLQSVWTSRMKPVISAIESLDQARDALAQMENEKQFGKIVLRISETPNEKDPS